MLTVNNISFYAGHRTLVSDVSFSIRPGEMIALLGANGAGKSTLLKMLAGMHKPGKGHIVFNGKPLGDYSTTELAKHRSVLNQQNNVSLPFTVGELVMMGRYPYFKNSPSINDEAIVNEVMEAAGITLMAGRSYLTLSGGEQQRVQLARSLAQLWEQKKALLLMDEPVTGMDILYQQQTLAILKSMAKKGHMVVCVLHDMNLASHYADRVLMLKNGRKWYDGTPQEILQPKPVYEIFEVEADIVINPSTLKQMIMPREVVFNYKQQTLNPTDMETTQNNLKQRYTEYKAENPKKRIREIATDLNVSEAELVATGIGETATPLKKDFENLLKRVHDLGYVMALTRNEYCVSERKGVYEKISFTPHAGLVLGEDIDLRLFMHAWQFGFAVNENDRHSLQFFDKDGTALHKIYLTDKSNNDAYQSLLNDFTDAAVQTINVTAKESKPNTEMPDDAVQTADFQTAWKGMNDSHEFFGLLKRFNLSRTQALRLAPEGFARKLNADNFRKACELCSEGNVPVMIFVPNHGCIQIHTGNINKLVEMGPWYNVLDPEFNLHLRMDAIAETWHVIKPSTDSDVNSIELYDENGDMILQMFGKRKPGVPELNEWREVVAGIGQVTEPIN
ncbi:heme ABC transporter ATP-binding protein [Mucilaginibacter sp. UR6-1]|uniref:heme ABC transporter ATP-binding protein n=1 Tax=Mucilaginibacter sp. UR6-1 TaxID=1435643 RepID=UPI001E3E5EE7|nr:heme ABC transporter ATP-binding protein [Mucilaginibacter sp. UR6-1]MCC8407518.1 heme ABC transporter ATP-binding protein [Mucilaginibacter sp. UR6-1]